MRADACILDDIPFEVKVGIEAFKGQCYTGVSSDT